MAKTTTRKGNDFRERSEKLDVGEELNVDTYYRSPLSSDGHLLGKEREWANDGLAWCGFALAYARDMEDTGEPESLGGLWVDERTSEGSTCANCRRYDREFEEGLEFYERVKVSGKDFR